MAGKNSHSGQKNWLETENPDEWSSTSYEQVYLRDDSLAVLSVSTKSLAKAGAFVAKSLPGEWMVVITAGPYRGHDVRYEADYESRRIHLDFYSPRPGFQYLGEIIEEIGQGLDNSSDDQAGVSA